MRVETRCLPDPASLVDHQKAQARASSCTPGRRVKQSRALYAVSDGFDQAGRHPIAAQQGNMNLSIDLSRDKSVKRLNRYFTHPPGWAAGRGLRPGEYPRNALHKSRSTSRLVQDGGSCADSGKPEVPGTDFFAHRRARRGRKERSSR